VQPPKTWSDRRVEGIAIITSAEAETKGLFAEPFELSFGAKQDGTALVVDFLRAARERGASYVADLQVHISAEHEGRPRVCVTHVVPRDQMHVWRQRAYVPGHRQSRTVPRAVHRRETRYENRCRMVSKPVQRSVTTYESRYDSTTKSYRSAPRTRMVTRYESRQQCRSEPVTRTVTRYEYHTVQRYVPPRWDWISKLYTKTELVETEPRCQFADLPTNEPGRPHRIAGLIYQPAAGSAPVEGM